MILLDTNYLILALVPGSPESARIVEWLRAGEELCASSVSWYEFLCGPVDEAGIDAVRSILDDRILPFDSNQAALSARLFNATGRKRTLRVDAMIAAGAISARASIATNDEGFGALSAFGLKFSD